MQILGFGRENFFCLKMSKMHKKLKKNFDLEIFLPLQAPQMEIASSTDKNTDNTEKYWYFFVKILPKILINFLWK